MTTVKCVRCGRYWFRSAPEQQCPNCCYYEMRSGIRIPAMNCPHCQAEIPAEAIRAEAGRLLSASRRVRAGGKSGGLARVPTACPKCGVQCPSVRAAGAHCRRSRAK